LLYSESFWGSGIRVHGLRIGVEGLRLRVEW